MKISEWNDKLYNSKSIIIYGAGDYGKVVAAYLADKGISFPRIIAIAVTEKQKENYLLNIPIKEIMDLREYSEDDETLVLIAVAEAKRGKIQETLSFYGFKNVCYMDIQLYYYMKGCNENSEKVNRKFRKTEAKIDELLCGINLDRVMSESNWLKKKDFTPGRAAVNNMYLYFLYKILDSNRFCSLLDIGMGQTSKMIGQYAKENERVEYYIVENDKEWIDFFKPNLELGDNSIIIQMDYMEEKYRGEKVRTYADFQKKLKDYKFDYISIDAPIGYDMKQYSRIDILKLLPQCLKRSWIIMIDDINRTGEYNTFKSIKDILDSSGIDYTSNIYEGGDKSFGIITSKDNSFFCTI